MGCVQERGGQAAGRFCIGAASSCVGCSCRGCARSAPSRDAGLPPGDLRSLATCPCGPCWAKLAGIPSGWETLLGWTGMRIFRRPGHARPKGVGGAGEQHARCGSAARRQGLCVCMANSSVGPRLWACNPSFVYFQPAPFSFVYFNSLSKIDIRPFRVRSGSPSGPHPGPFRSCACTRFRVCRYLGVVCPLSEVFMIVEAPARPPQTCARHEPEPAICPPPHAR